MLLEHGERGGMGVEPKEDGLALLAVVEAAVELVANGAREAGDFGGAGGSGGGDGRRQDLTALGIVERDIQPTFIFGVRRPRPTMF
jgi:hypothetical protein